MKFLSRNDELLEALTREAYLPNLEIIGININLRNFKLVIEVDIRLFLKKGEYMKLFFSEIREFGFNYTSDRIFYNIETYKLLKHGEAFYISFDPIDNDLSKLAAEDNDIILCDNIEGYLYS